MRCVRVFTGVLYIVVVCIHCTLWWSASSGQLGMYVCTYIHAYSVPVPCHDVHSCRLCYMKSTLSYVYVEAVAYLL